MITKAISPYCTQIKRTAIYSIIFFLSICFLLKNGVFASSGKVEDTLEKAYSECLEKSGGVTVNMRSCTSEAYEKWDLALNEVYQKLIKTLKQNAKKHLRVSQEAWIKFRDAEFDFIDSISEPGTAWLLLRDESRLEVLRNRVLELRRRLPEE